jgi:hypothetical protein
MFPTGFTEVYSLGVRKVIFGGFDQKNFFFLQITNNGEEFKKNSKNLIF